MKRLTRQQLMTQLAKVRDQLRDHGIRDAPDYAEILVAEAVGGEREGSGVNQGFDLKAQSYGRIEVKCRQLPCDGRIEERVEIGASKQGRFDNLAIVVFFADFRVKGAILAPYSEVWKHVASSQYGRISYSQACRLPGAIDITAEVAAAANC